MRALPPPAWLSEAYLAVQDLYARFLAASVDIAEFAAVFVWYFAQASLLGVASASAALCLFAVAYAALVPRAVREMPLSFESAVSAVRAREHLSPHAMPLHTVQLPTASSTMALSWRDFASVAEAGAGVGSWDDVTASATPLLSLGGGGQEYAVSLSLTMLEDALLPRGGAAYASLIATVELLGDSGSKDGTCGGGKVYDAGFCTAPTTVVARCRRRLVIARRGAVARMWAAGSRWLTAAAGAWLGTGEDAAATLAGSGVRLVRVDAACLRAYADAAGRRATGARVTLEPSWFPEAGLATAASGAAAASASGPAAPANVGEAAVLGSLRFHPRMRGVARILFHYFWPALAAGGGAAAVAFFIAGVAVSVALRAYFGTSPGAGVPFPAAAAVALRAALQAPLPPVATTNLTRALQRPPMLQPSVPTELHPLPPLPADVPAAAGAAPEAAFGDGVGSIDNSLR